VTTSPEAWATFLAVKRSERSRLAQSMLIGGAPERVEEFLRMFGAQAHENSPDAGTAIRVQ